MTDPGPYRAVTAGLTTARHLVGLAATALVRMGHPDVAGTLTPVLDALDEAGARVRDLYAPAERGKDGRYPQAWLRTDGGDRRLGNPG